MRLTARSLSASLAAIACLASAGAAAAQAARDGVVRSHSVRVTRTAGALPPLAYGSPFADPWWGAGWGTAPAWGAWPTAGAGAWRTTRAGAWPVASAGVAAGEMDRMMAEMDRDMAAMSREIDAMLGPVGWAGSPWSSVAHAGAGMGWTDMAPAFYPMAGAGYPMVPGGYGAYAGYPVAASSAASGYSWSSRSVDDGRCVRTTTESQTMGGVPQRTTRTEGRC